MATKHLKGINHEAIKEVEERPRRGLGVQGGDHISAIRSNRISKTIEPLLVPTTYKVERIDSAGIRIIATARKASLNGDDRWSLDIRCNDQCLVAETCSDSPLARIDQLLNQGIVDQGHVVGVANEFKRWPGMGVD